MKKALSVMLALLLCCMPALAEEAAEYLPYTNPAGQYSLEYPSCYLALDAETIDNVIASIESGELGVKLNLSLYSIRLKQSKNVTLFLDPGTMNNTNLIVTDMGTHLSADVIVEGSFPYTREQYATAYPDAVYSDEGSIRTVNGTDFAHLGLQFAQGDSTVYMEQYALYVGNLLYTFTFGYYTDVREAEIEHMLSTFTAAAE